MSEKLTLRSTHAWAGLHRRTDGLWIVTTLGWWTWNSTRVEHPIADRVVALITQIKGLGK